MELSLNISGESISAEGKVLFMPKNADEYVFLHEGEPYVISRESRFLDTFLGRSSFCVRRGGRECVGRFRLHGLRKLGVELNLDTRRVVATLPFLGRWGKSEHSFVVEQTSYAHQGNELVLSNREHLGAADILTGCFLLSCLSRVRIEDSGAGDME